LECQEKLKINLNEKMFFYSTGLTPVRSSGPTGQAGLTGFFLFFSSFPEERKKGKPPPAEVS